MPLVEKELLTHPEHLSSPPVFSGVRVTRSLVLFLLAIVLSVLLRYTDSDCPFGIFKLFFLCLCLGRDKFAYRYMPSLNFIFFLHVFLKTTGVEIFLGQAQAQVFLIFFNPSPVSDLPSPNL